MLSSGYFSRDAVTGNHPNALQPRSENSLNASVKVETPSKKRKLSELIEGNDLGGPVTIFVSRVCRPPYVCSLYFAASRIPLESAFGAKVAPIDPSVLATFDILRFP